jgi:hypothetical protein
MNKKRFEQNRENVSHWMQEHGWPEGSRYSIEADLSREMRIFEGKPTMRDTLYMKKLQVILAWNRMWKQIMSKLFRHSK